jgi:hypothetical protein
VGLNVTLKQAERVLLAYQAAMQRSTMYVPVVQSVAMLSALKTVFGDEITVVSEESSGGSES